MQYGMGMKHDLERGMERGMGHGMAWHGASRSYIA